MKPLLAFLDFGLWRNRQLLWQFTIRSVELKHKGSYLGLTWSILNPLLMLGLYVFVFGYIFGGSFGVKENETPIEYGLGIFLGLTIFHFAAEIFALSVGVIAGNPNFVKKVVFPLEILPAATVGSALVHLGSSLVLFLAGMVFLGPGLSLTSLWLPVILLPVIIMLLGISWLFAALGVFFRDLGQFMQFLTMALMFSSGVFYSALKIPDAAWHYLRFNPLLLAIEMARNTVLWQMPLNTSHYTYLCLAAVTTCGVGYAAFKRMKPAFADVL